MIKSFCSKSGARARSLAYSLTPGRPCSSYRASGGNIHADRYRCSGACVRRSLDWTDFDLALGFTTYGANTAALARVAKGRRAEASAPLIPSSRCVVATCCAAVPKTGVIPYCGGAPSGPSGAVPGPDDGALCSGGATCSDSSFSLHHTFLAFQLHSAIAVQSALPSPLQTDCLELSFDASSQALRRRIEQATTAKRVDIGTLLHE